MDIFVSCFQGIKDRDFGSSKAVNMSFCAPFCLNEFILNQGFNDVMAVIRYTSKEAQVIFHCFHEAQEMINAFNDHYFMEYILSLLLCIDRSMNSWLNKFCPSFMALPCKPHQFGNEYHLIADGDGGKLIMWRIKLVEGNDQPMLPGRQWVFPLTLREWWKHEKEFNAISLSNGSLVWGNIHYLIHITTCLAEHCNRVLLRKVCFPFHLHSLRMVTTCINSLTAKRIPVKNNSNPIAF